MAATVAHLYHIIVEAGVPAGHCYDIICLTTHWYEAARDHSVWAKRAGFNFSSDLQVSLARSK
jgi:hypothetical protein